jgi:hypothetical protein
MIRNRSTRLTDIPPRFEINVYDLGRLRSFSTHTLRANVSYWIQIWESTRRKVMMGGVSIGALWKETYYAIPARDHGRGEKMPRLLFC